MSIAQERTLATARLRSFTPEGKRTMRFEREAPIRSLEVISIAFLLAALFLTPLVLRPADVQAYYLALVLTALTSLPLVTRIVSGTLDVFEPIIPISLLIGLAFGVRTMYLAFDPVTLMPLQMGALRFDDFVHSALLLTIAAYSSLLAGYYVIAGPMRVAPFSSRRFGRRIWAPSTLNGATITAMIGIAGLVTVVSSPSILDPVTNSTTAVGVLMSFAQLSGCILALHLAAGDTRRWLRLALWCGVLPLSVWQSLALGTKSPILLLLYVVVAARHYEKGRIPLRVLVAGTVVAVLVVFPTVNLIRQGPERPLTPSAASMTGAELVAQIASLPTLLSRITLFEYVQIAGEGVISRSTGIDSLALLLRYDVSRELGDPASYLYIPAYAFIPRVIWPTKPVLNQGTRFGRLLVVPGSEGVNSISSFGIFHMGDLFVSFGLAGVLIGMCVLGCLYRLLYRFFDPLNTPDLGVKFLYVFLLWNIVSGFQGDIPSAYANTLKSLLVWVLVKSWFNAPPAGNAMRQPRVTHAGAARPKLAG